MIRLEQKFQHHSQVVSTELDPLEAVLLHLESQKYYTLNETGSQIWKYLEEGLNLRQITQELQEQYDIGSIEAEKSVLSLIGELESEKLVQSLKAKKG